MLYGLTGIESKANAPDWYGTEVAMPFVEKRGTLMSICDVAGWKLGETGVVVTLREVS